MKRLLFALAALAIGVSVAFGLSRIGAEHAITELEARLERDTGLSLEVSGADVSFLPYPGVTTGALTLSQGEDALISAQGARLEVSFSRLLLGQASYKRLVLEKPVITLGGTSGRPDGMDSLVSALMELEAVVLNGGTLRMADRDPVNIVKAVGEIGATGIEANATVELHKVPVAISAQLEPTTAPDSLPWQLAAEATSPLFNLKIRGSVGQSFASFEGKSTLVTPSLRSFLSFTGHPLPAGPGFDVAQVETMASYVPGVLLNLKDLKLKLDGNEATGALQMTRTNSSSIQGTLAFDRVDLSPYLSSGEANFSGFIADLNRWRESWRADLRLSAARVKVANMEGSFAGSLVINDSLAELAVGSTTLGASEMSGRVAITSPPQRPPSYEISLNARALNAETAARLLPLPLAMSGSINTALVATAHGSSLQAVRRSLTGEITLDAANLDIKGPALAKPIERLLAGRSYLGWAVAADGETSLQGLQARARVEGGHLSIEKAAALISGWQVSATGGSNLSGGQINVLLEILSPGTEKSVHARLTGDRAYPVWRPDPSQKEAELTQN